MLNAINITAQEKEIEKIRTRYNEIQQKISEENLTPVNLMFSINRPGVGIQATQVKFYWNNMTSEFYSEIESGKAFAKTNRVLWFVETSYNVGGGENIFTEYLFDHKQQLIFYFKRSISDKSNEFRLYFAENKLIKSIYRSYQLNNDMSNGTLLEEKTDLNDYNDLTKKLSSEVISNAEKLCRHFSELFDIEAIK